MKTHSELVEELCSLRKNWKHEDFVEAYGDEWCVPSDVSDCHEVMEQHIYNSYETDYIKQLIKEEADYQGND